MHIGREEAVFDVVEGSPSDSIQMKSSPVGLNRMKVWKTLGKAFVPHRPYCIQSYIILFAVVISMKLFRLIQTCF